MCSSDLDALRVAVESPDESLEWLDPVLFSEGPYRRAFAALTAWPTLVEAIDATEADDPEAAEALRRAVAEQTDGTITEVFLRLAQETARRTLAELRQAVLGAADPLALSTDLARVASLQTTLMGDDVPDDAKLRAGTDLLAWLLDPGEGSR